MMSKATLHRRGFYAALTFFFVTLAGCGASDRLPLKGTVTFEGEPVNKGYIQFRPMAGTTGPTSGADIKDGAYEVASVRGLFKGSYQVNIQAWKRSEGVSIDPVTGESTKGGGLKQFLPPKYNDNSKLTVEIGGGEPSYDFALEP